MVSKFQGRRQAVLTVVGILALIGAITVASHAFDWTVWTFERDPMVLTGSGTFDSPYGLMAAGEYGIQVTFTNADLPGHDNCIVELFVVTATLGISLSGDGVFEMPGQKPVMSNGAALPVQFAFSIPHTGWYSFLINAGPTCAWQVRVARAIP